MEILQNIESLTAMQSRYMPKEMKLAIDETTACQFTGPIKKSECPTNDE